MKEVLKEYRTAIVVYLGVLFVGVAMLKGIATIDQFITMALGGGTVLGARSGIHKLAEAKIAAANNKNNHAQENKQ